MKRVNYIKELLLLKMKIEHLALNIEDPVALAKWYCENLGFTILKEMNTSPFAHFIADSSKNIMLEIFCLPDRKVTDYRAVDPAVMHLGFQVKGIEGEYEKLVSAGATVVSGITVLKNSDKVVMLRDPWGLPIQLVERKERMV